MLIGRVTKCIAGSGHAEFTPNVRETDFIYYKTGAGEKVMCRITKLASTPQKGTHGKFMILEPSVELPRVWDNLYLVQQKTNGYIEVGFSEAEQKINLRVNPFFRHTIVAGKTGRGKTHFQLVLAEEFVEHKVPSLIVDTQCEFPHLKEAVVVDELNFEDLISHLKFKKTVVYNLQGYSYKSKVERCYEILSRLWQEKERDYQQAENDVRALKMPPILLNIDEAEIYAPKQLKKHSSRECREILCDITERGSKYGIGMIVGTQRLPALHTAVSSQCNNGIIFHLSDKASKDALKQLPYVSSVDLKQVKNLPQGQCLLVGEIVPHPTLLIVRDIKTKRAKNLDFEKQLGLTPLSTEHIEEPPSDEEYQKFFAAIKQGITMEQLESKFPTREVPIHGKCVIIPERHFKQEWKNTLEAQGLKVVHCPDMPGGDVYLVRADKTLAKIKEMAEKYVPRDVSARPY